MDIDIENLKRVAIASWSRGSACPWSAHLEYIKVATHAVVLELISRLEQAENNHSRR